MHNHNLLKNLGQRIKKRRIELELTQNALAKMAGYTSGSSINKIELGLVDITQTKAILIAKALNCLTDLNLTKIESRPSHQVNWEYRFYIDVLGDNESFKRSFAKLKEVCTDFNLLGVYKSNGK